MYMMLKKQITFKLKKIFFTVFIIVMSLFCINAVSDEAKAFHELLKQNEALFTLPLKQFRPAWDEFGKTMPSIPKDIIVKKDKINGVTGEWVISPGISHTKVILHFHGGGFAIGSPAFYRQFNYRLSEESQAHVFSVDYRLSPEHPYPAGVTDCLKVYKGLLDKGFKPEDIAFTGDSAGGGIVFQLLLLMKKRGIPMPGAVAAFSPWVNLTNGSSSLYSNAIDSNPKGTDVLVSVFNLHRMSIWYLKGKRSFRVKARSASDPMVSPVFADLTTLPPVYITVSNSESLYNDSMLLLERLHKSNVNATIEIGAGLPHAWPIFPYAYPEGPATIKRVGRFLNKRLNIN